MKKKIEPKTPDNDAKSKYIRCCASEATIPIFSQPWWLDATAGKDNWDVALVDRGGRIDGALPYVIKRKFGLIVLTQPVLTPRLGPWLRSSEKKMARKLADEKLLLGELVRKLPAYAVYSQCWNYDQLNWLPFYWSDFTQTTRYSYVLDNTQPRDSLWKGLQENIRGDVRKAEKRYSIQVNDDAPIEHLIALNRLTFARQGKRPPYDVPYVKRIYDACSQRGIGRTLVAVDPDGRAHAGCYLVWDNKRAYYLIGGGDPELRNSGATSLCMWRAIQFASTVAPEFDFEGSMIEPVERFFRAFGAQQRPYFQLTRYRSFLAKTYDCVRRLRGAAG